MRIKTERKPLPLNHIDRQRNDKRVRSIGKRIGQRKDKRVRSMGKRIGQRKEKIRLFDK